MRYIGQVIKETEDTHGKHVARFKPLFFSNGTALQPERLITEFPPRGLAIWFNAQPNSNGRIFLFDKTVIQVAKSEDLDHCHAVAPRQLHPVLDLSQAGTMLSLGARLFASELETEMLDSRAPVKVFIQCSDGIVGPLELERTKPNSFRLVEGPQFAHLRSYPVKNVAEHLIRLDDGQLLLDPNAPGLISCGEVDWRSDPEVLRTLLKQGSRGGDPDSRLTAAQAKQIVEDFYPQGSLGENPLTDFRIRRIRYSLKEGEGLQEARTSLLEALSEHPVVTSAREQAKERGFISGKEEGLANLAQEKEKAIAELAAIHSRLEEASQDLKLAQVETEHARKVEEAIVARIQELEMEPERIIADAVALRPLLKLGQLAPPTPVHRLAVFHWPKGITQVGTDRDLHEILATAGLSERFILSLLGALSGGLVPLAIGARAAESFERFARVTLGGRFLRVHVGPGILEPGDLLGRFEPSRGVVLPHRSRTLDFLLEAERDGRPSMVLLEGANRAPTESLLVPLMDISRRRGSISIYHPSSVSEHAQIYPPEVAWPGNLILAAVLTEGPTALPLIPSALTHGVLMDVSEFPLHESELSEGGNNFEVSEEALRLGRLSDSKCLGASAKLNDLLPNITSILFPFVDTAKSYGQGLLERSLPSKSLKAQVVTDVLLPAAASLGIRFNETLTDVPEYTPTLEERLRRVIHED